MSAGTVIAYQVGTVIAIEDCDERQEPFTTLYLTPESAIRMGEKMAALGKRMLADERSRLARAKP